MSDLVAIIFFVLILCLFGKGMTLHYSIDNQPHIIHFDMDAS